jgi:HEAT repeat protein
MRMLILASLVLLVAGCGLRSTDAWLARMKDAEVVKRRQAIRELANRTGDAGRIVPALVEALRDESGYVRRDAALTLGKFGPQAKQAVGPLQDALKDRERQVRTAAGTALKKIEPGSGEKNISP